MAQKGAGPKLFVLLDKDLKQFLDELNIDKKQLIKGFGANLTPEQADQQIRHLLRLALAKSTETDLTLKSSRNGLSKDLIQAMSIYKSRPQKEATAIQANLVNSLNEIRESSIKNTLSRSVSKLRQAKEQQETTERVKQFVESARREKEQKSKQEYQDLEARIMALKLPSPPKGGKRRVKKVLKSRP